MKRREKILAGIVLALFGIGLVYLLMGKVILRRAGELTDQKQSLLRQRDDLAKEKSRLSASIRDFAALRDRTLADDSNGALVAADMQIKDLAHQAALGQSELNFSSFSEKPVKGLYRELASTITTRKSVPLEKLVNLLYLMDSQNTLHSITTLSILPKGSDNSINFSLRYATLVFDEKSPLPLPARAKAASQPAQISLTDERRQAYDGIVRRNVFLPYVPLVRTAQSVAQAPKPSGPAADPNEQMVVVGLPCFGLTSEVHVADAQGNVQRVLKVGDSLPVGEVAMVDYRVLPMPGKPSLNSYSRVILRKDAKFYAIELGQRLSDRRVLSEQELPGPLQSPASRPAPGTAAP